MKMKRFKLFKWHKCSVVTQIINSTNKIQATKIFKRLQEYLGQANSQIK